MTVPEIRELASLAELKRAEQFQREVWGKDDPADNSDLMLAIQHEGGLVAGAFLEGRMLGFLFGFPTSRPEIQHSHRLAVHPDSRGMGLGVKLKWFQRDWCLQRGITLVRWTYDPLRRINASLNIARLGATAGTYHEDYYGQMEGINAGIASDRLLADWQLTSSGVKARASDTGLDPDAPAEMDLTIAIPEDLDALIARDLDRARSERLRVRHELTSAFADHYRITGFDNTACRYILSRV
ncbi:GNAT family N-acetyltransferase [Paracoccus methylarcula]|uniref:GNAT family N-acetyltransferase n=1 Tax=Paracoccus methylarcula TaxID=72022 RepID=A0A422QW21_9RHOB|nr:GNAT family N-acetyltransferase [Paracoccus methylarcula]RNF34169.1 GNAT family N-acetyltransferase [Paracoccus methylarcula]